MEIEKFITEVENGGHVWLADEMRLLHENPELISQENIMSEPPEGLPALYFYIGVAFGAGMERKHDL